MLILVMVFDHRHRKQLTQGGRRQRPLFLTDFIFFFESLQPEPLRPVITLILRVWKPDTQTRGGVVTAVFYYNSECHMGRRGCHRIDEMIWCDVARRHLRWKLKLIKGKIAPFPPGKTLLFSINLLFFFIYSVATTWPYWKVGPDWWK